MDKETLSNYGWIVICVLVLAVMLALATPFGTFVADGFKATYTGLFQTGDSALDVGLGAVGVKNTLDCGHERKESGDHSQKECGHYNCQDTDCGCVPASCGVEGHWSGDGKDHTTKVNHRSSLYLTDYHTYACECTTWVVPEGGTYMSYWNSKTYTAGETVQCRTNRDKYLHGNYKYEWSAYGGWTVELNTDVTDKQQTSYGSISESVYNSPVVWMDYTFDQCTNLTVAPKIPSGVKSMHATFRNCSNLITYEDSTAADGDFGEYIIPDDVTDMFSAFIKCKKLTVAPEFPSNVTEIGQAFSGCTSLITPPSIIPSTVKSASSAFGSCEKLSGTIRVDTNNIVTNEYGKNNTAYYFFGGVNMNNITLTGSASKDVLNLIGSTGKNWTPIE